MNDFKYKLGDETCVRFGCGWENAKVEKRYVENGERFYEISVGGKMKKVLADVLENSRGPGMDDFMASVF